MYLVKTPFLLRWLYPTLIWRQSAREKCIYLTFDDGPIPVVTPFVLETLKKFGAKATFFCIGDNVTRHPDIYKLILADGHAVGNHTFNHLRGWDTPLTEYIDNVQKCAEVVKSNLFRPPHGRGTRSQYSALRSQYSIVMWDVLSGDFDQGLSPEKCLQNVIKNTGNGSIVVFHDSLKAFERLQFTLPRALEYWAARGYSFKAL